MYCTGYYTIPYYTIPSTRQPLDTWVDRSVVSCVVWVPSRQSKRGVTQHLAYLLIRIHYYYCRVAGYEQRFERSARCTKVVKLWYAALYTTLYYSTLNYSTLYYTILYYTILYYATLRYATLCYAMLCYAMLCYAVLNHTMLYYRQLGAAGLPRRLRCHRARAGTV